MFRYFVTAIFGLRMRKICQLSANIYSNIPFRSKVHFIIFVAVVEVFFFLNPGWRSKWLVAGPARGGGEGVATCSRGGGAGEREFSGQIWYVSDQVRGGGGRVGCSLVGFELVYRTYFVLF